MRVLLDTCVLSEIRKPDGNRNVRGAVEEIADEDLYISVITVGEIIKGIELLEDGRRKRTLRSWLRTLERDYADRLLSVDREAAHIWGELTRGLGHEVPHLIIHGYLSGNHRARRRVDDDHLTRLSREGQAGFGPSRPKGDHSVKPR